MSEVWKSPRKIEQEIKEYNSGRFERQMQMVDRGELPRAIAIAALQEEFMERLITPQELYGEEAAK